PEVGMLYGNARYWFSWSGRSEDTNRDYFPVMGIAPDSILLPPAFVIRLIAGNIAVPCTCSVIVRRDVVERVGGFDELPTMYDDQRFYARVALAEPVMVSDVCWDWYRQHPASTTAAAAGKGQVRAQHFIFLEWLKRECAEVGVQDEEVWIALRRQRWYYREPVWLASYPAATWFVRRLRKAMGRVEKMLPSFVRRHLWSRRDGQH
ncbi:MAG: hypothetical protein HKN13_11120, partial [Rhodothermales bacterium]|nr:hypothetical protein [Rhodothermales bacterium]